MALLKVERVSQTGPVNPLIRGKVYVLRMRWNSNLSKSFRLHEKVVIITFTVTNTGAIDGTEVWIIASRCKGSHTDRLYQIPQLYTTPPASANTAPMNLKGFDNVPLAVGESKTVTMQLSRFDLSVWNVITQRYELHSGETTISVGASSRDIRLTRSIRIP